MGRVSQKEQTVAGKLFRFGLSYFCLCASAVTTIVKTLIMFRTFVNQGKLTKRYVVFFLPNSNFMMQVCINQLISDRWLSTLTMDRRGFQKNYKQMKDHDA